MNGNLGDFAAMRSSIERAWEEIIGLSKGTRKWRMCIPAHPTDSDIVLSEPLKLFKDALDALEADRPDPKEVNVDESVVMHAQLPPDTREDNHFLFLRGHREAFRREPLMRLHFCRHCNGWIEGAAVSIGVDGMDGITGRKGELHLCRRCSGEIGFHGTTVGGGV